MGIDYLYDDKRRRLQDEYLAQTGGAPTPAPETSNFAADCALFARVKNRLNERQRDAIATMLAPLAETAESEQRGLPGTVRDRLCAFDLDAAIEANATGGDLFVALDAAVTESAASGPVSRNALSRLPENGERHARVWREPCVSLEVLASLSVLAKVIKRCES